MEVDDKNKNDIQPNINSEEAKQESNSENNIKKGLNENVEMNIEEEEKVNNLQKIFTKFLSDHTIYEAIPEDMKILVFNDELLIKDSIEAMIKEDIYCGLLYNSEQNKHSGVFTIRDVLGLLLVGYKKLVSFLNNNKNINSLDLLKNNLNNFFVQFDNIHNNANENKENILKQSNENGMDIEDEDINNNNVIENKNNKNIKDNDPTIYNDIIKDFHQFISLFDNITLQSFIELFHMKENNGSLISLFSDSNLEECVKTIQKNNIHRLIVQDKKSNNLSGFITYEAIFEYFIENYYSSMTEFHIPLKNLDIIVKNVITLNKNENLHKCMETFYKEGISMIPIMDEGNVFGYLYLKDIIYFFSIGEKFNFSNTIESFLKDLYEGVDDEIPYGKKRIAELNDDTNLKKVFEEMSISPERKLIIKNDNKNIGIVALYDIFKKLVI
jgi:predicted transcriptional regulator